MTISATSCVRSEYLALRRVILLCMTKVISVTLKMSLLRHRHILKPLVGAQMYMNLSRSAFRIKAGRIFVNRNFSAKHDILLRGSLACI
jgi:hypothetical protein